jgi:hypothetical protein
MKTTNFNTANVINTSNMLCVSLPAFTPEELKAAKKHRNANRNHTYRASVVDNVQVFYKSPVNKALYAEYVKMFEKAGDQPAILDVLVKCAVNAAGYDAWMCMPKSDMKYYRIAFKKLFSDEMYDGIYHPERIARAQLYKKAAEQNFICPGCGGKLDIDVKRGPLKVTADHIDCQKNVGRTLGSSNIQAVHATCNSHKHTATPLEGGRTKRVKL